MLKSLAKMLNRLSSLRRDEEGFVVMVTLCLFLFLFVLCASIYAVGETVRTRIKLQNACDAAAYSAAVVQADGLSRMATINRAMSWTYVHMTNMQMDYITYRWLRLTEKRFREDYENAKAFHSHLVANFNLDAGWISAVVMVFDALTSRWANLKCNRHHEQEGIGWWCGSGPKAKPGESPNHKIRFNGHRYDAKSFEELHQLLNSVSSGMDNSDVVLAALSGGEEQESGGDDDHDVSGEEEIYNDYQAKIDALDVNDPDYSARKAALEEERDRKIKIDKREDEISDEYQKKIDELDKNDPDYETRKAELEEECDRKIKEEVKTLITEEYQAKIDALDTSDPDEYNRRKAELEDERDRKIEEEQRLNEEGKKQQADDESAKAGAYESEGDAGAQEEAERIRQQGRLGASGNASLAVNTVWGAQLGKAIDADKKNIQLMNAMLSAVNVNMYESMKTTAQFVLASMLKDPRMESDKALKNYSAYFYIPRGSNPYQMGDNSSEGDQAADFFSPLYNTEPCERLFLQMNTTEHTSEPLYSLFPLNTDSPEGERKGWGLDQWFIRGGANGTLQKGEINNFLQWYATGKGNGMPSTIRTEGTLGIQRCYKDANINETGAGLQFLRRYVSRGNHIANLFLENAWLPNAGDGEKTSSSIPGAGNALRKVLSTILDSLAGGLVDQYADITPSVGNWSGSDFFAMCPKSSNTVALYSDYDWSSAKWICIQKPKLLSIWADLCMCALLTGKCKVKKGAEIYCDWGSIRHKRRFPKVKWWHRGLGHYHFPKWFCGLKPRYAGDGYASGIPSEVTSALLIDMIPPLFDEKIADDNRHGYMSKTLNANEFLKPLEPLVGSGSCSLNETVSPYHTGGGRSGNFDRCVLDQKRSDYESCACMVDGGPRAWNFYNDCVAGVVNGHARIYGDDKEIFDDRYVGEKCEPWVLNEKFFNGLGTIVVGVAMKHSNPFVQLYNFWGSDEDEVSEKSVLSAFDPPSSGVKYQGKTLGHNYIWTMSAARAAVRRLRRGGEKDGPRMYQVTYDAFSDAHNLNYGSNGAHHFENGAWKDGKPTEAADPKIMAGCVCDGNATQFKQMWNLCEQDWDATLLPLRYAGRGAEVLDAARDTWRWKETAKSATDVGNENPLNPNDQSRSWHPLDPDSGHILNLKNMMPGNEHQLKLDELLKKNKVL